MRPADGRPCKNKLLKIASGEFCRLLATNIEPPYRVEPLLLSRPNEASLGFLTDFTTNGEIDFANGSCWHEGNCGKTIA